MRKCDCLQCIYTVLCGFPDPTQKSSGEWYAQLSRLMKEEGGRRKEEKEETQGKETG